jgi:transcriptional regulator with XRE-family HTH domain
MEGESPVRVWREFRGLSLRALAAKSGVSPGYLSEIELGKKPGSVEAYKALAEALDTSVDWLVV